MNLLSRIESGNTYYYMYNGHADVTALLNAATGAVDATYYYDAFGNVLSQTGAVQNSIRYAGYQYDEETGLYYLNARMYDPITARFMQEDTYRGDPNDPLSLNLYAYCLGNPIKYFDPTGHKSKSFNGFLTGTADVKVTPGTLITLAMGFSLATAKKIAINIPITDTMKKESWLFKLADKCGLSVNFSAVQKKNIVLCSGVGFHFQIQIAIGIEKNKLPKLVVTDNSVGISVGNVELGLTHLFQESYLYLNNSVERDKYDSEVAAGTNVPSTKLMSTITTKFKSPSTGIYVALNYLFVFSYLYVAGALSAVALAGVIAASLPGIAVTDVLALINFGIASAPKVLKSAVPAAKTGAELLKNLFRGVVERNGPILAH